MKAKVDETICAGSNMCEQTCPAVFKVVNDVAQVKVDPVPPEAEESCRSAMNSCPTGAISIEE